MNALTYKGYAAIIEFDAADKIFVGRIVGIRDIVSFHAETVKGIEVAFQESVDDYLEACQRFSKSPNKPYSGHLMLRIPPELHAQVAALAKASGKSINTWAVELFSQRLAA
jgi:predicted HicB family RNase H-like nuclease